MKDFKVLMAAAAVVVVIIVAAVTVSYTRQRENRERMDEKEQHYDADDLFLMLNTSDNLAGFYKGSEILQHMIIRTNNVPVGVYDVFFKDGFMYLERTDVDATVSIPLSRDQFSWIEENYKSGYPALVYREE